MFIRFIVVLVVSLNFFSISRAQIVINEVVSSNFAGLTDEDGSYSDWIELYNKSESAIDINGYVLKDTLLDNAGWVFPAVTMPPKSYLTVFASGKDRKTLSLHFKTLIKQGDQWQYIVPTGSEPENWRLPNFNASTWSAGASGFGFGDNDDNTVIQGLQSIFIRKEFALDNIATIEKLIIHVDYDDAFAAFINGNLVAVENIAFNSESYTDVTVTGGQEALLWQNQVPRMYEIQISPNLLREGKNVFALQGYNYGATSSDFSLIPFLTVGSTTYTSNDVVSFLGLGEGSLHTNFKIDNDGEPLYLLNKIGVIVDSVKIVALPADVSYGRYPDGDSKWYYFPTPTPQTENINPTIELRSDSVYFSKPGGFYQSSITVALTTSTPQGEIRYTTDGSEPTINSAKYASPLLIANSTFIRAASFFNNVVSSKPFSSSYFINNQHQLPVVSILGNSRDFFDYYEGILVDGPNWAGPDPHYGANFWQDWEKPINIEYFDKNGFSTLNQGAGVKVAGNWSRMKPQKSMAFFARKQYGKGSFEYQFFQDKPFKKHETFLLRNSGNDWDYTMLRDGFVSEFAKYMNVDRLAYQPTVVYINGEYWGILNMREKPNEHYFESNYGVKEDNLNLLENQGSAIIGNSTDYALMTNYLRNYSLESADKYLRIANQIDVDCFIDYQIIQLYISNRDWPGNNIKFWKSNEINSRWRWVLFDTDFGLSLYNESAYTDNALVFATEPNNTGWPNPSWSTLMLRQMLTNETFKNKFINRMADFMNSTFDPSFLNNLLDSITAQIDPEIGAHQQRWGRSYYNWEYNTSIIRKFIDNRPDYMRSHIIDFFNLNRNCIVKLSVSGNDQGSIQVNTLKPTTFPFEGNYFSNVPIPFKALPKPGYRFVKWEKASSSTNPDISLVIDGNISLHAIFEPVQQRNDVVVINEVNFKSDSTYNTEDWIELYNPNDFTIDLSGWILSDATVANGYVFPQGLYMYPHSYLVVSNNKMKFNKVHPQVKNVIGDFSYGLSSTGDVIALTNTTGDIVDYVVYNTSSPWPAEPLTTAATLQLIHPSLDNSLAASWNTGPLGGTPGLPNGIITSKPEIVIGNKNAFCFPNRFSDYTTLCINSEGFGEYLIQIVDIQGRILFSNKGVISQAGQHYIDLFIDGNNYQKGLYIVKVKTIKGVETLKVVKQ